MTDAYIIAGDLAATDEPRTVAGMLLPFGVVGSTNLGKFSVDPGAFEIPRDVSHLNANEEHQLTEPRARFISATETEDGIAASFRIAETDEGDDLLARIEKGRETGKPMALSAEVKGVIIKAGKAIAGKLTGAAFVERGAFPGAALLASAADTEDAGDLAAAEVLSSTVTEMTVEDTEDGTQIVTTTVVTEIDANAPEQDPEQDTPEATPADPTNGDTETMTAAATVPAVIAGSKTEGQQLLGSAQDVFEAITRVMSGEDTTGNLLAALSDIKISGSGQLPTGGNAVQPSWLGELASERSYQRRYMSLIKQGSISAIDEKGFTVATGAEPVQQWAGNKAELPTMTGTTAAVSSVFQRWGVANDIAREFYDIPAGRAVIEAYVRLLINSYYRVTDFWTLDQLKTAAGTAIAAETYPSGYSAGLGKVLQAIDSVDDTEHEVTSVVVAADVWKELRYTPKDQIPEYVSMTLNRTGGQADGTVQVVKDKAGKLGVGQVLAIARDAAHVNELPGSPMQLDALEIAKGGIDKAIIGYTQFMAESPAGLKLIGVVAP